MKEEEGTKTSFVCSLIGLITSLLFTPVGFALSIIGLCLLRSSEPKYRTASMVLGILGITVCLISWFIAFMLFMILFSI